MTVAITRTLSTVAVLVVTVTAPALAQREPTLSDIAGCNEQAASRTGASALPHPGSGATEANRRGPAATPRDQADAPKRGPSAPMPGTGGPGEKTDPSGSVISETPDPLVKGMDAGKADDAQYRAAYRDCMRAKVGGR
jgi:hypothetical protein